MPHPRGAFPDGDGPPPHVKRHIRARRTRFPPTTASCTETAGASRRIRRLQWGRPGGVNTMNSTPSLSTDLPGLAADRRPGRMLQKSGAAILLAAIGLAVAGPVR